MMDTEAEKIARAGKLLCVDNGQYSDYYVMGFFVALKDFDPMDKLHQHLEQLPEQKENYGFDEDKFIAYLIGEGLLLEVDFGVLYTGGYGEWETVSFTPSKP